MGGRGARRRHRRLARRAAGRLTAGRSQPVHQQVQHSGDDDDDARTHDQRTPMLGQEVCEPARFCRAGSRILGQRRPRGRLAAAACAARRAAAMKFDLPPGSGMTGGLAGPSAASEAAMRSAGDPAERPRVAEPGSSGWSGGRFGSIGRRSVTRGGAGLGCGGAATASSESRVAGGGRAAAAGCGSAETPVWRGRRLVVAVTGGTAGASRLCVQPVRSFAHVGLDHRQAVDHVPERTVHGFERVLGLAVDLLEIGEVALQRADFRRHLGAGSRRSWERWRSNN